MYSLVLPFSLATSLFLDAQTSISKNQSQYSLMPHVDYATEFLLPSFETTVEAPLELGVSRDYFWRISHESKISQPEVTLAGAIFVTAMLVATQSLGETLQRDAK